MTLFDEHQLKNVREFVADCFNKEELRTLCLDLSLEYEDLPGEGKEARARELVAYCQRRGRLPDLLRKLHEKRAKPFEDAGLALFPEGGMMTPFPEALAERAPYPIAVACARFNAAQSDKARFEALDCLTNNLVKYLTAIALSQYWQDQPDKAQLRAWLGALSQARLVTSLSILEAVSDHYAAAAKKPMLYPILFQPYEEPVEARSPIAEACGEIRRQRRQRRARDEDITPRTWLSRLLAWRETVWESDPGELDAAVREAFLPKLQLAFFQLLDKLEPLLRYPLCYVERVDQDGTDWVYTLFAFPGASGEPLPLAPFREPDQEAPGYKAHHLYLCSHKGQPLLNLHPLLICYVYKLYFLEQAADAAGEDQIWYRHCGSPKRFSPPGYFRILSTLFRKSAEELEEQDDPVTRLEQANAELEQEERKTRLDQAPLPVLMTHLSDKGREGLAMALGEALRIGRFWLGVEFLLMGLTKQEGRPLGALLHELGESRGRFRGALRGMVGVAAEEDWRLQRDVAALGAETLPELRAADPETLASTYATDERPQAVITPRMMQVLRDAARLAGEDKVGHTHLLLAALRHVTCPAVNLLYGLAVQRDWQPGDVPAWVAQQGQVAAQEWTPLGEDERGARPAKGAPGGPIQAPRGGIQQPLLKVRGVLATYGRDLTALAQRGELRPAIGQGAHDAMVQMGLILQQTQANNPILLGDPGVGKTAIVEGFAWRLAVGAAHGQPVIPELARKRVVDLPAAALVAGTKYRGELEERLQKLVAEVRAGVGELIVFIDEIHTILGGRAEGGLGVIADALKPALARGEFPCIGATTVAEYRRYIEADPALARRFTPVWIEEPTEAEAIEIVQTVAQEHLGPSHGVTYPKDVVEEAVRLSLRYLHDERLPGKVIKLLDQAGPRVLMGGSLRGLKAVDPARSLAGEVTLEVVREIVAERTGVPLARLSQGQTQKLLGLEGQLRERVKGQDEAIVQVARVVKRARAGLADPRRPLGVFLFAGPTGVGKTELALALAEALFNEEDAILRLDMSEYMEKHQISRLIGAPPGYKGYEEEGQLTGRLRRRPYSVVLLDEIEKAHPEVQHLFLQLFDAGRLTDARGNLADGRNAIFVMTTNLGAKVPLGFQKAHMPSFTQQMRRAIEEHFTPEFLNRVDRIVYLGPLDEDTLLKIFDREFEAVAQRLRGQGIEVQVAEGFKRDLCKRHTDAARGARKLQRAIEDEIVTPLTDKLLAGEIKPGMKVSVGEGAAWDVSEMPLPSEYEAPAAGPVAPAGLDLQDPEARDALKAQNEANFDRAFDALAARLREQGLEIQVEIDEAARDFLCDPFWTETTLERALAALVRGGWWNGGRRAHTRPATACR